jgi:hypothetical protein
MVSAVRPLGSLSMARGCARIDSGPDTAKIGSANRVEVHHARLLAVIGVRKTFPHGLGQSRKCSCLHDTSVVPSRADVARPGANFILSLMFRCHPCPAQLAQMLWPAPEPARA